MHWVYLGLAILLEVCGTSLLKLSAGFTRLYWGILALALYMASFIALAQALKRIEVGVAYALWSGIGIVLIAAIGAVCFRETLNWAKLLFIGLILVGAVGLNLCSAGH